MNKPSKYNAERSLVVHSNFSFEYISWEHWSSATVANSLFNGSIFENCIFENIAFNNAYSVSDRICLYIASILSLTLPAIRCKTTGFLSFL